MDASVENFFTSPNLATAGNPTYLIHKIASVALQDNEKELIVLPWRTENPAEIRWYVIVENHLDERIREELISQVGVSYTDFRGQRAIFSENDIADSRIQELLYKLNGDKTCFKIKLIHPQGNEDEFKQRATHTFKAFLRFLDFWNSRPKYSFESHRGHAEILHDYRMAILNNDLQEAENAVKELRSAGHSSLNILFLEIELRSIFHNAKSVLEYKQISELLGMKRPALVSDYLIKAVNEIFLLSDTTDIESVIDSFSKLEDRFTNIITTPGQIRSTVGVFYLALKYYLAEIDPKIILDQVPTGITVTEETKNLVELLASRISKTDSGTSEVATVDTLQKLFRQGRFDAVLDFVENNPLSTETVLTALNAGVNLSTLDASSRLNAILNEVETNHREIYEQLRPHLETDANSDFLRKSKLAKDDSLGDWNVFFEYFYSNPAWDFMEIAQTAVSEWPLSPFIDRSEEISKLVKHIEKGPQREEFIRTLPFLTNWLSAVSDADAIAIQPINLSIMEYLSLHDQTKQGLNLLGGVSHTLIVQGFRDTDKFETFLECLATRWDISKSVNNINWATNLIENLLDNSTPDQSKSTLLMTEIFRSFNPFWSRISPSVRNHIHQLAQEHPDNLTTLLPSQSGDKTVDMENRSDRYEKICMYSLTDKALNRAKRVLQQSWPSLTIETISETVATDRLKNLSRNADLMVVGIGSAQHAATNCIQDNRPRNKKTIKINGKGATAFIEKVEEWLEETS